MADLDDTVIERPVKPDHVVLAVFCDGCDAQLVVEAATQEAAREQLRDVITTQNWSVIDRLEGALDTAAQLTGHAASMMIGTKDLCGDCRRKL